VKNLVKQLLLFKCLISFIADYGHLISDNGTTQLNWVDSPSDYYLNGTKTINSYSPQKRILNWLNYI